MREIPRLGLFRLPSVPRLSRRSAGGGVAAGADVNIRAKTVAARTTNGTQDITIAGFGTPKLALFIFGDVLSAGSATGHLRHGIGAIDGTRQWATAAKSQSGVSASSVAVRGVTDGCVLALDPVGGAVTAKATASFITDGVRVDWSDPAPGAHLLTVILFGGADLEAWTGKVDLAAQDSAATVTPNFEANAIIEATIGLAFDDTNSSFFRSSFGLASWDGETIRQCSMNTEENHAQATTAPRGIVTNDSIANIVAGAGDAIVQNIGATSFEILCTGTNWSTRDMGVIALKLSGGAQAWAGVEDTPTSTGLHTFGGPGFEPVAAILCPTMHSAVNTLDESGEGSAWGISALTPSEEHCYAWAIEDAATTTSTQAKADTATFLDAHDGTDVFLGTLDSMGATGPVENFTAVDGTVRKWPVLAIGAGG